MFGTEKLYPTMKMFDYTFSSFDTIPACDRRTDILHLTTAQSAHMQNIARQILHNAKQTVRAACINQARLVIHRMCRVNRHNCL